MTERQQKARTFLEQYRLLYCEIQSLQEEIEAGKNNAAPRGAAGKLIAGRKEGRTAMRRMETLTQKLLRRLNRLAGRREAVEEYISGLDNTAHRSILRRRYILGHSWVKISMSMHYSQRQCYTLHAQALEALYEIMTKGKREGTE